MSNNWLIYGANGYTGRLIVELALQRGLKPTLAGRNPEKMKAMGEEFDLPWLAYSIDDSKAVTESLQHADVLLNCAGPFSQTADIMMNACIANQTHYLDITGEIAVFELAHTLSDQAEKAGVLLCPGVGFDVVPTDCLAAKLASSLPNAKHLELGFDSRSGMSPGTAKTSVEGLGQGGKVRRGGEIKPVPLAYLSKKIDFGDGEKWAMTIPWGDVSTAFRSTGIPDIDVYIPASPNLIKKLKRMNMIRFMLGWGWVIKMMQNRIEKTVRGPGQETRDKQRTFVWGQVTDGEKTVEARVSVPNGYSLTADAAVAISQSVLEKSPVVGHQTPSKLMGADFLWSLTDVGSLDISSQGKSD